MIESREYLITRVYRYLMRNLAKELPYEAFRKILFRLGGVKIGRNCQIGRKSKLSHSVINDDAVIGKNVQIGKNCIVGSGSQIKSNAIIVGKVKMGRNVIIGQNSIIANADIGDGSHVEYEVVFMGYGDGKIRIGKDSYLGIRTILDFSDNIKIGNFVHIAGPSTAVWTHSSANQALYGDSLANKMRRTTAPVIIEGNVYIGGNCTIYPGVCIHNHSIVAPNSAVTKDVEPYSLVGGVPAKFINKIEMD